MALYLGSKKVAGNTTSAPLDDDVKDYKVSFDDTGVIEETSTVNDIMTSEIKTGNKLSVIFGGIKKVLSNILTSITNINSSFSQFNTELDAAQVDINSIKSGSFTVPLTEYLRVYDTRNVNDTPAQLMTNGRTISADFKNSSVVGISNAGMYVTVINIVPWSDKSGGYPTRIAISSNGIWKQYGTGDTTWSGWSKIH